MNLMDGEEQEKQNNGKKIVIGALIVTLVLIVLVIVAILVLKQTENSKLKLIVDGKSKTLPENLMITDSNTGTSYLSISKAASLVGYEFYNGEYKTYSENKTQCYVECENELAMFELNSNIIYKNNAIDKLNFDTYIIDKKVASYGNELYAIPQAIQMAFNIRVIYDEKSNTIYFETLPYLVNYYKTQATKYGYTGICEDFITQKALVYNLLVVEKDKKYGVVSTKDFSTVIGNKYDNIIYIENTKEFIVTNEGKTGLLSINGEVQIGLRYDEIGLIDGQAGLYYAKNDNLYGVLNKNGKVLVYVEYDDIGIDRKIFPIDNIKNNLFLYDNCIPLKKGIKWGIANKDGNIILNFEYDELGYAEVEQIMEETTGKQNTTSVETALKDKSINNVVVIPDIEGIVIGKGQKYGVANSIGKIIIPCEFDKIYSITNEGKDEYYIEKNGKTTKLTKYLEDNKINVEVPSKVDITVNKNTTENTTNTINNETTNSTNITNSTNNKVNNSNSISGESIIIM